MILSDLPEAILVEICEFFCPYYAEIRDFEGLFCLSMACFRLRDIAQKVLFCVAKPYHIIPFLRTIIARPELAARVATHRGAGPCNGTGPLVSKSPL